MQETLLAYAPAVLATALAIALRLLRSRREASAKTAALQRNLAALERRNCELQRELGQARESAITVTFRMFPAPPSSPPISRVDRFELPANSSRFTRCETEVEKALRRLQAINNVLPLYGAVEEKYIAEVDTIVDRLGQATGMNMSRWLGIPQPEVPLGAPSPGLKTKVQSCDRDLFRFTILSLLAFCNYQIYHSQSPSGFAPSLPPVARRIH